MGKKRGPGKRKVKVGISEEDSREKEEAGKEESKIDV